MAVNLLLFVFVSVFTAFITGVLLGNWFTFGFHILLNGGFYVYRKIITNHDYC